MWFISYEKINFHEWANFVNFRESGGQVKINRKHAHERKFILNFLINGWIRHSSLDGGIGYSNQDKKTIIRNEEETYNSFK